jgi:hypothetical protein
MSTLARRTVAVAVATLALFAPAGADAHALSETTVKSGRWHGVEWELRAQTWSEGSYCVAMTIGGREDGRSCGSIREDRIAYAARSGRPAPNYVVGPVIGKARSVEIKFFDRPTIRIATIRPPRKLEPGTSMYAGTRFFAAVLSCPATPRSLVARGAAGRIVARRAGLHRGPKAPC